MKNLNQEYDLLAKTLIIGDSTVGKSSLMLRFTENVFSEAFLPTIGIDFRIRVENVGNTMTKFQIWDTAGQERFRTITKSYYKGSHGIIIVYDVTNSASFLNVDKWIEQVREQAPSNTQIILVGTKCDLESERQVSYEDGLRKAEQHGIKFIETSAKTSTNIDAAFKTLVSEIIAAGSPIHGKLDLLIDKHKTTLSKVKPRENEIVKYATCC